MCAAVITHPSSLIIVNAPQDAVTSFLIFFVEMITGRVNLIALEHASANIQQSMTMKYKFTTFEKK